MIRYVTSIRKKHRIQMTAKEVKLLKMFSEFEYHFTEHSKLRIKNRRITKEQVFDTIRNGEIVEYLIVNGVSNRVMFRKFDTSRKNSSIYVVVDIVTKAVITAFRDKPYRNSSSSYNKSIDIIKNVSKAFNYNRSYLV